MTETSRLTGDPAVCSTALLARSLWTPVLALDRLNSWLRSKRPLWCSVQSSLKPVIYWTKTQAILDLSKHWHIGMRRVMVKKPCRRCDGTGYWISWFDEGPSRFLPEEMSYDEYRANYGERCRGCKGTGTATLKFIETTIGPVRWHTPADKWYMSSLDVYVPFPSYYPDGEEHYELANGWEPEQPGRPLPMVDVERDMVTVLFAWPHEVCFSIDYHHHAGLERTWKIPDIQKAEQWLRGLFERANDKLTDRR